MLPAWRFTLSLLLLTLCTCITRFDIDAGGDDAGHQDVPRLSDTALGRDTRASADHASSDAHARDLTVFPVDAADRPESATSSRDVTSPADTAITGDASGNAQIGQHCENRPCTGDAICIGDSSNAICRLRCQPSAGACNPQIEYCSTVTLPDGGPSPNGACLPGQDFGQTCVNTDCAEVYICVYMGADAAAQSCHARCQLGANDAGCAGGTSCVNINRQDGGACF